MLVVLCRWWVLNVTMLPTGYDAKQFGVIDNHQFITCTPRLLEFVSYNRYDLGTCRIANF